MGKNVKYPAKIIRPVFKNALVRERLFDLIEDDDSWQLLWICGPAGYGKTTLISTYIEHKNIPCIWYQWDVGDSDPASFYYYLDMACRKVTPGKRTGIPKYSPEFESNLEGFSQRFFEVVFNRLDPPALLVFDNLITQPEKYFLDIILNSLSRIQPDIKLVVVSRSDPPPALSILKVRNQIKVIGLNDLRFNDEEFEKAAEIYELSDVPKETLRTLNEKLEGWAAGLLIVAEGHRRTEHNLQIEADMSSQDIYDFFAGEIDKSLDDDTRDFLFKTAYLPHITVNSADHLTGYERSQEILDYLVSHNLFTSRRKTNPVTYQYHSLFKNFLRSRAEHLLPASELEIIKTKAANLLWDTGHYEYAAALLAESKIWTDLKLLILETVYDLVRHGRYHLLEEWILSMPEDIYSRDQSLQYWLGICKFPFSPKESRPYFVKSMKIATGAGDAAMAYRAWAAAVESVVFEFNDLNELGSLVDIFDSIRMEFPEYPSKEIEGTVAIAMLMALVFQNPGHPMIEDWARRAVSIAVSHGQFNDQVRVALIEGMRLYYMGNMVDMKVTIETLVEPYAIEEVWLSMRPLVCYLSSFKEWTFANIAYCRERIEEGLNIADSTGVHMWDRLLLGQGVMCALTDNDLQLARKYLDRMSKRLAQASKHDYSFYHYLLAWEAHLMGDRGLAVSHAQKGYDLKMELGYPFGTGSNGLALAEAQWAGGDRKKAARLLAESRKIAQETKSGLLSFLCDMTEANFTLEEGNKDKAAECLRSAFTFGSAKGIYNFIWLRKDRLSRFCSLAIENGIVINYAQELIDRHSLVPHSPAVDMEDWPWPVKLYTLGRFELVVRGKKVKFARKSQERPMALLMAIAALGGRNVNSYQLVEALWPDSDGATGQQTLATTLHRLRRIIDIKDAVIFSKGLVTLNPDVFWVDMWAVERTMGRISPVLESGTDNGKEVRELFPMIEKVLDLYRGHFLGHDGNEPWCIAPRERLRSKYLRNLMNYCSYLEGEGEFKQAVKWYEKALELENLSEEIYQSLMMCFYNVGQKSAALSTYNRCKQALSDVLGVEPSVETERIREKVLKDA